MRLRLLIGTAGAAIALVIASTASATTSQTREPWSGFFINPCTGESIAFEGVLHSINRVEQDATGSYHIDSETNGALQGVGVTSGARYAIPAAAHISTNFDPTNVPIAATGTQTFDLIGAGPDDNATLTVVEHLTIDPNGDARVFFSDITASCRG